MRRLIVLIGLAPTMAEGGEREQLEALGYVGVTDVRHVEVGVVHADAARVAPGHTLISVGHRPEALLIDATGEVVRSWHQPFLHSFPALTAVADTHSARAWRRVRLAPNGDLLAIHEGIGLVRLSAGGALRWAVANRAHHDLEPLDDGTLMVLTRTPTAEGLDDHLSLLNANGDTLRSWSLLTAWRRSQWAAWIDALPDAVRADPLHTNAARRLDGRVSGVQPAFTSGRWLLSSRHLDAIAVFDPAREVIVWAARGPWARQHDAQISPSGGLLLFDNQGAGPVSRALLLDPSSPASVVRAWAGTADEPLRSEVLGGVQELVNGNWLVVESMKGRVLEVAPDGSVVWEYRTPARGPDARSAAILSAERVAAP